MTANLPPEEVMLRLFNYSDYQIKGLPEDKKKSRKLTPTQLKKYRPREWEKQKREEDKRKSSPQYKREQERKKIEKEKRENMLDRLYNR